MHMEKTDIGVRPAYRIETDRLIIRCYSPRDAPLLQATIQENVEHLLPWMSWVKVEPEALQKKIDRLRGFRSHFDKEEAYPFGIFNLEETTVIGGCLLIPRVGPDAMEIGYWIHVNYINKGYATEAVGALTKIAFEIERVKRIEIHTAPENVRSNAIPRKLGFTHEATLLKRTKNYKDEPQDVMIWTLFHDNYKNSSASKQKIIAFDVIGRKIDLFS
jgi:RimJ/RimL family protein N-acetyltransferase